MHGIECSAAKRTGCTCTLVFFGATRVVQRFENAHAYLRATVFQWEEQGAESSCRK